MSLFYAGTKRLLGSAGWKNFDEGVDITHADIEERVDMHELAKAFEVWLDDELNKIDRNTPKFEIGKEFHLPADCPLAIRVDELSDEEEQVFHHGECAMPKCSCTHYNDDRDHWPECPYGGQRISRDEVSTHAMLTGE